MEKTYVVTYKGRGKGFAQTEMLIKACSKKDAREKVTDKVAENNRSFNGITIKSVEPLN